MQICFTSLEISCENEHPPLTQTQEWWDWGNNFRLESQESTVSTYSTHTHTHTHKLTCRFHRLWLAVKQTSLVWNELQHLTASHLSSFHRTDTFTTDAQPDRPQSLTLSWAAACGIFMTTLHKSHIYCGKMSNKKKVHLKQGKLTSKKNHLNCL